MSKAPLGVSAALYTAQISWSALSLSNEELRVFFLAKLQELNFVGLSCSIVFIVTQCQVWLLGRESA